MKSILITYDASVDTGDRLEYGEAAVTLDSITDDMVARFMEAVKKKYKDWSRDERTVMSRVTDILINLERLRGRIYVANSIKSVKIISSGEEDVVNA